MRRNKSTTNDLNSPVGYLRLLWAKPNSSEYTKTIEVINDCYRKMLMIGKSKEVFWDKVPDLLSAKTYNAFTLAKDNIERRYDRYLKLGGHQIKDQNSNWIGSSSNKIHTDCQSIHSTKRSCKRRNTPPRISNEKSQCCKVQNMYGTAYGGLTSSANKETILLSKVPQKKGSNVLLEKQLTSCLVWSFQWWGVSQR
jgi:hypothetical protein